MTEKVLSVRQASEALCLRESTVRAWIARRKLGFVRLGRSIRVPESEIARLLSEGRVPPAQEAK
jgi:excisionase family DNA binding protein